MQGIDVQTTVTLQKDIPQISGNLWIFRRKYFEACKYLSFHLGLENKDLQGVHSAT